MSTSSARLPVPKVLVVCSCGKKYRVPASKAGKKISCKQCKEQLRVPRETGVSDRSRGSILAELGIDPVRAEEAYKAEVVRREKSKAYRCTRCEGEIGQNELKGAYIKGELVCPGCRATDEVADRKAERLQAERAAEALRKANGDPLLSDYRDPVRARWVALGYAALFFVGIAGPLLSATSMRWGAIAIGLAVAAVGGLSVYRHRA